MVDMFLYLHVLPTPLAPALVELRQYYCAGVRAQAQEYGRRRRRVYPKSLVVDFDFLKLQKPYSVSCQAFVVHKKLMHDLLFAPDFLFELRSDEENV